VNALIDTNVIVDVMTMRQPFFSDSSKVLNRAERGEFTAWVCATTVTTVFYLVRRHLGSTTTVERLRDLVAICGIAPVNHAVVDSALQSSIVDFEDAILETSALTVGVECIVTRHEADFRNSTLLIFSPTQFLSALA